MSKRLKELAERILLILSLLTDRPWDVHPRRWATHHLEELCDVAH